MIYLDEHVMNMMVRDHQIVTPEDSIVKNVVESFKSRSETGFKKYGTNLDRKDLNLLEWLNHLQMELQDAILYAEKLKQEYNEQEGTFNKSDAESKNSNELPVSPRSQQGISEQRIPQHIKR